MILIDTSIWIEHVRCAGAVPQSMLLGNQIIIHPFVIGEIALGHVRSRHAVINALRELPQAALAAPEEVLGFIEQHHLAGTGIGYVDAHLLASARLSSALLWTHDKRLHEAAERLGTAYRPQ